MKVNVKVFNELLAKTGKTKADISREIGYGECYLSNALRRNNLRKVVMVYLEKNYGITPEQYVLNEGLEVEEEKTENISSNEIIAKLDELIIAINKLGNIEMQQLEYLKDIKDKPNGYIKPIIKKEG